MACTASAVRLLAYQGWRAGGSAGARVVVVPMHAYMAAGLQPAQHGLTLTLPLLLPLPLTMPAASVAQHPSIPRRPSYSGCRFRGCPRWAATQAVVTPRSRPAAPPDACPTPPGQMPRTADP
eukprot:scaffold110900_cov42-Phaeocystis_antarctica.AAC.2